MTEKKSGRNDDVLSKIWSAPRLVRDETTPYKSPGVITSGKTRTDRSQKEDCDVNQIVARFHKTGVLPGINAQRVYSDVSDSMSYHDAMNVVARANEQFNSLTAEVRKRFSNDPAQFLEFFNDPKNDSELVKLGLATPRPKTDADRVVDEIRASNKGSKTERESPKGTPRNPAGGAKPSPGSDDA